MAQETGNKMVYAWEAQDAQDAKNKVAHVRRKMQNTRCR